MFTHFLRVCVLTSALFLSDYLYAQSRPLTTYETGLAVGLHHQKSQDHTFSPMIYSGQTWSAGRFYFQYRRPSSLHVFSVAFDQITIDAHPRFRFLLFNQPLLSEGSDALNVEVRYRYGHRLMQHDNVALIAGAALDGNFSVGTYGFGLQTEDAFFMSYALSPRAKTKYKISKRNQVSLEVNVALVAWVSRTAFSTVDEKLLQTTAEFWHVHKQGELVWFTNFSSVNLELMFSRELSSRYDMDLIYRLQYVGYDDPLPYRFTRNFFEIQLGYKF